MAVPISAKQKQAVVALLREARAAGWAQAKIEMKPDGTLSIDASMIEAETHDDFDSANLRMSL